MNEVSAFALRYIMEKGEGEYVKSSSMGTKCEYSRRCLGQSLLSIKEKDYGIELQKWSKSEPMTYYIEKIDEDEVRELLREEGFDPEEGNTYP